MASSLDDSSDPSLSFTSDRLNLTISLPGLASKEGTYTLTAVNGDGTDSGEIVLDIKSECFTQIMIMIYNDNDNVLLVLRACFLC